MKSILFLIFVCISICCRGNAIDNLKTLDDVKAFIKDKLKGDEQIDFFETKKRVPPTRLSNLKFLKIDLNSDGLTDLLINGTYLFAIVDNGNGNFEASFIDRRSFMNKKYTLAHILVSDKQPKVIVKAFRDEFNPEKAYISDTLVYKYGGFVDYTKKPEALYIEKISFSTSGCYGTCPVFELSVNIDGTATFDAEEFNDLKGNFTGSIEKQVLDALFNLVNYIGVGHLKDRYKVNWTDDQTADLTITYKNGTVKHISDYGLIGTFGLQRLYELMFAFRLSQKWKAI